MDRNKADQEPKFKVVDRRRFDEDGNAREGVEEQVRDMPVVAPAPVTAQAQPVSQAAEQQVDAPAEESEEEEMTTQGGLTFSLFIQSLAQQALMGLGLIPWPHNGLVQQNLDQARETLDVLLLLRAKTKGNLSAKEQRMFDTILYELRAAYMQVLQPPQNPMGKSPV